ncbi:hypothetical protein EDC96DRAFT_488988 [Choanephora cucurbitarum]|nr:hypothetical protein EDC96DRAFT_488988 [Choanephora cucurbitarum]
MPRIEPSKIANKIFDYVIIGGGTAGCVLANRLSSNGRYHVLVLEAGKSTPDLLEVRIPLFNSKLKNSPADWQLKSAVQEHANQRQIGVPLGKLLGGSSAFNACIAHRCSPSDYDGWNVPEWSYGQLAQYFRKAETFHDTVDISPALHGTSGPFHVSQMNRDNQPIGLHFKQACKKKLGLEEHYDMTDMPCQIGVTGLQASIYQGQRVSTGATYLPLEIQQEQDNLSIALGCQVNRLVLDEQHRVTHVEFRDIEQDTVHQVQVGQEAILSAGAILSPVLLLQSGLGPKEELEEIGIESLVDLPGVGKNLQNHWRVPLVHETKTADMSLHQGIFQLQEASLERALKQRDGPLTELWPDAVAFMKIPDAPDNSSSQENTPQIELFAGGLALCRELPKLKHLNCATLLMVYVAPFSRGSVKLDKAKAPLIDFGLLKDERDMECLEKGLKLSMSIAQDEDYQRHCVKEWLMYPENEQEIQTYIKDNIDTLHHYAGTCKMGPKEDRMAVVDHHLKVHGVNGLRVVDASFFPKVPAGQTCFPVIACAERAADLILQGK